jgi:hypothetical protein
MLKIDDIRAEELLEPLGVSLATRLQQAVTLELARQLLLQLSARGNVCKSNINNYFKVSFEPSFHSKANLRTVSVAKHVQ